MIATNEAEHQHIAQDGDQAGGEQVVQHVHVGGDARDQAPHGVAVEKGHVQFLQVRHQLPAQVEHGALPGVLHQVDLRELEDEGAQQYPEVEQGNGGEPAPGVGREEPVEHRAGVAMARLQVAVHRNLGEQRSEHLQPRLQEQKAERYQHIPAVGAHVAEQAAHQARIVCFSECLFFHSFQFKGSPAPGGRPAMKAKIGLCVSCCSAARGAWARPVSRRPPGCNFRAWATGRW